MECSAGKGATCDDEGPKQPELELCRARLQSDEGLAIRVGKLEAEIHASNGRIQLNVEAPDELVEKWHAIGLAGRQSTIRLQRISVEY